MATNMPSSAVKETIAVRTPETILKSAIKEGRQTTSLTSSKYPRLENCNKFLRLRNQTWSKYIIHFILRKKTRFFFKLLNRIFCHLQLKLESRVECKSLVFTCDGVGIRAVLGVIRSLKT